MHVVSDLFSKYSNTLAKTVYYAAKQAFKQLQRNKAKLSEPASINGLHNIRVYARASLLSAYTNENRGGHIYTVTDPQT